MDSSRRWYALPAALAVLALIPVLGVLIIEWGGIRGALGPGAAGTVGDRIQVELAVGHTYHLYMPRRSRAWGDDPPESCALAAAGEEPRRVPLNKFAPDLWQEGPGTFSHFASFEAPLPGRAVLTCQGGVGSMAVVPDVTAVGHLQLAAAASAFAGLAACADLVIIVALRRASARPGRDAVPVPPAAISACPSRHVR